jgi:CRISPR-associated protein Csb2
MPVIIKLTFSAGRYHATPWGRHVNEGVPEWPPSPWRLLRALVAVWKRTRPDASEPQVRRILEALAPPPRFHLPPHRVAHTRHYMPWEKKGPADRTLVCDTFVSVSRRSPLLIGWPDVTLSADDRTLLAKLLGNLSSLGRAEAWVEAELVDGNPELTIGPAGPSDLDPVPVICLDPATAFSDLHYPRFDQKKLAQGEVKPEEFLFDCPRWHLCLDTETMHREKWPALPGSRWVNYTRPAEATTTPATLSPVGRRTVTVARFLLDAPALPSATETLPLAEAVRSTLLARVRSATLAGKNADGRPLHGHRHAYFLPADEDGDGRLDHVTLLAEDGFTPDEVRAFQRLRGVRRRDGEVRLLLTGLGCAADFRSPLLAAAPDWVSATPFTATRYPKRRGQKRDAPEDCTTPQQFAGRNLVEELERLRARRPDLPAFAVEALPGSGAGQRFRPLQYQRFRRKQNDDGGRRPAGGFRIRFAVPTSGPICLGHSAHFGLGLFVAEFA